MSTEQPHVHIFDKGCHQPWYAELILARYLLVRNDAGDRMVIVRDGDHPKSRKVTIYHALKGEFDDFPSLDQALIDMAETDIAHYLEDAMAIRKGEYGE